MKRNKYKIRSDGRREGTKVYNGKQKHFYGKTDAEIDAKIAEYEKNLLKGEITTFKEIAEKYWEEKQKDLAINTLHGYDVAIRRAIEEFGDSPIGDITPQDVYQFLEGFKSKAYSSKTISNTKTALKGLFDYAFINGKVKFNPCTGIPVVKGKKKVARLPATDEDVKLINEFRNESITAKLLYFLLWTGARIGEASALQMKDIDFKKRTATVTKTLAYGNSSTPTIKLEPKTENSIRKLAIPKNVMEILPTNLDPETFIFFPNGLPKRRAFDKAIMEFKEKHGIKCTPHQLRHSYASMLHSAGIDVKDAQSLLGHSSIVMTQDIYTHIERNQRDRVLKSIDDYVSSKISSNS